MQQFDALGNELKVGDVVYVWCSIEKPKDYIVRFWRRATVFAFDPHLAEVHLSLKKVGDSYAQTKKLIRVATYETTESTILNEPA